MPSSSPRTHFVLLGAFLFTALGCAGGEGEPAARSALLVTLDTTRWQPRASSTTSAARRRR
jgi:hypothetical protein